MRRPPTTPLPSAMLTDVGLSRQRSINQDAALVLDLPSGGLYAVADGMGGHAAGELASNLALDQLSSNFLGGKGSSPERLAEAVQAANLAVLRSAVGEYVGMGTTLITLLVERSVALIAHVGDSRAYLLRGGDLHRLTEDHSWVAEQVRLGHLTESEARTHQWRSVVSNALGGEERVRLELYGFTLQAGDRLLLCSDGLSGVVDEADLHAMLSAGWPPTHTTRQLINAANEQGGPDNITAIVVDIEAVSGMPVYRLPSRREDGPMYVDLLLSSRRGNSPVTYVALVLVYFTLMGLVLYPQHRSLIASVGLGLLAALLIGSLIRTRLQLRDGSLLPDLPIYSAKLQLPGEDAPPDTERRASVPPPSSAGKN
ncbi:PP2C family protein-serine/threonine phosphatase [Deinococcus sp.]|uniref:PP2C family protein-serine/threonine phosphatase n=1 Tax=Deinococcus sp. TaxID=47478 RepID=UPI003CC60F52